MVALALCVTLATGHRGERLVQGVGRGVDAKFAQAGFRLKAVHVQGASPMATADIIRAAGLFADQPLVGLDLGFDRIDLRNPEMVAVRPRQTVVTGRPAAAGA